MALRPLRNCAAWKPHPAATRPSSPSRQTRCRATGNAAWPPVWTATSPSPSNGRSCSAPSPPASNPPRQPHASRVSPPRSPLRGEVVSPYGPGFAGLGSLRPHFLVSGQAALRRLQARVAAALLLDQIEFHPARFLRRREDLWPWHHPFSEQNPVALLFIRLRARSPVLQVAAIDAARIGVDPRHRIVAHFHARADVELQHHILRRIGRDHLDGPLAVHQFELRLVIVIAGAQRSE